MSRGLVTIAIAATLTATLTSPAVAKTELVATRDVRARTRPAKKASRTFVLHRDDVVLVLARRGKWVQVQSRGGKRGWVRSSALEELLILDEPGDKTSAASDPDDRDTDDLEAEAFADASDDHEPGLNDKHLGARGLHVRLGAGLGSQVYARDFSSNGDGPLGAYQLSVSSIATAIDGGVHYNAGGWFAGARTRYTGAAAAPGVRYQSEDGMSAANRLVTHAIAGELVAGVVIGDKSPILIGAAAGYRLDYFVIDEIQENPGLLAREQLAAPTASVSIETGLGSRTLLSLELGALFAGKLQQTANLEDGTSSDVSGYGGGLGIRYLLRPRLTVGADYRGRQVSYTFSGQSRRQFDVTEAERSDTTHVVTVQAATTF